MSGLRPPVTASPVERALWTLKTSFLQLLVRMSSNIKPSWMSVALSHAVVGIQILSFGLADVSSSAHLGPVTGVPTVASFMSFVNPMLIRMYWGTGVWMPIVVMALVWAAILVFSLVFLVVSTARTKSPPNPLLLRIYRTIAASTLSWGFIPLLGVLLQAISCEGDRWYGVPAEACFGGVHTPIATGIAISVPIILVTSFCMAVVFFDKDPVSTTLDAASHGRGHVLTIIARTALVFVSAFAGGPSNVWVRILTVAAAAILWLWVHLSLVPYASTPLNCAHIGTASAVLWVSVSAGIAWLAQGRQDVGLLTLLGAPIAGLLGGTIAHLHFARVVAKEDPYSVTGLFHVVLWTRHRLRLASAIRLRSEAAASASARAAAKGTTSARPAAIASAGIAVGDAEVGVMSAAMVIEKAATTGIEALEDMFPQSGIGHAIASSFYASTSQLSHYKERQALTLSRAMSSAFDIEFLFFSALYSIQDGSGKSSERKGSGRNVISVVDRALFLQHKRLALEAQARCYQVHIKLMNHVASREMDVGYLHSELGSQLDAAMRNARDNFDAMLRLNPDSPQALSLAAEFHAELGGNLQRAMDLLSRARRIEEQTRRLKNKKIPHVPFGGLCDDADVSATDEGNAMFTISTDRSRLGEIVSVNQAGLRMFGSSMLLGANISVITPSPIAEYHNLFLERFVQTGVSSFLDSTRFLLAQHAASHVFPVRFRLYETPPSAQDMRPKLTGVIQPVQTDEGFMIVGDESLEFCMTAVCAKTADVVGRSAEELGRGTVPAALLLPELFGTAGQGGQVDSDMPAALRGRDASVMGRSILSKKRGLRPPGSIASRQNRSVLSKSKRSALLTHRDEDADAWAAALPTRFQQALTKPTKVRLFIPAVIEGEDEDAEQQEALDALIDEADAGSDADSTGVVGEGDDAAAGTGARVAASLRAKGAKGSEASSMEVSVRVYMMPRPGPEHASAVAVSWSPVNSVGSERAARRPSEPRKPASAHAKSSAPKPRVRLAVPEGDAGLEGAGMGSTMDPTTAAAAVSVSSSMGPAAGDDDARVGTGAGLPSAVGISGPQMSIRAKQMGVGAGSKRSASKRNAAARYRSMTGMDDEAPADDRNTFVSGMSKSSATKRSLKRSLDTMAKSRNLGIERLRAMLWFAVSAFAALAIATMAALGPWATRIQLHALSIDAIGQTVQLVEDINYNVGLLATEAIIAPKKWPVTNMSANLFRMDALPKVFSDTTQTMYSQLRSLGGPVLTFMIKEDAVTLDVIQSSAAFATDGAASRALLASFARSRGMAALASPSSGPAPEPFSPQPVRSIHQVIGRMLGGPARYALSDEEIAESIAREAAARALSGGVGVPASPAAASVASKKTQAMSGFDALGAVQAAAEALRRMTRSQIQVGVPDVDFLRTNAQSRLTPALNSTIQPKFESLVTELEFISDVELWTAVTAVAFSVICQLIGSIAAAQRMHSEEVILLRVFYHIPIDIAQGLVHKAEARLRKHRKSAVHAGPDGDDGGDGGNGLIGQGEAGGGGNGDTEAGSDDSEERRVEDEEDMKWQLILDKHANATRFRQMDEATASRSKRTASKSDDEAPLLDDTGDGKPFDAAEEAHDDAMERTKDVIVSDSKMLRQTQIGLTVVPSIIIVAWFLTIFIIEGQFHMDVVHNAERVVHMRELTTSCSAHTYTIATSAMLYSNNVTLQLENANLGQSQRERILFRMNRALHGGHSALGDELLKKGHKLVFDLAPTAEASAEYEVLVRNACPAVTKGLSASTSFFAGTPTATTEACEAAHDGIFAQGLRTAIMRYLSRSQSLESSIRHRIDVTNAIALANTTAGSNVTKLRETFATVDKTIDALAGDLLTLFDPWLRAAVDSLADQYAARLPRLINSTWELERNITIVFAVALFAVLVLFLLPRMRWYERVVAATRRMLLVIPDDVLSVVPTLTTAIVMLESSSLISDGRGSKKSGKADAIKRARRKADREAAKLLRKHKHDAVLKAADRDAKGLGAGVSGASLATADVEGARPMATGSAKVLPTPEEGNVMTLDERHSSIVGGLADGSVPSKLLRDERPAQAPPKPSSRLHADPGTAEASAGRAESSTPAARPAPPVSGGAAEAKAVPAMDDDEDLFG